MIELKNAEQIKKMRKAGQMVARVLQEMQHMIEPGITPARLNQVAEKKIRLLGGVPAFLGYRGFPASICVSVNEEVVHGIPGITRLQEGDIVSIDVGVIYRGYFGDAAATFPVGKISPEAQRLIEVTRNSLERAITRARPGNFLSDISHAVQSYVEENGFSVVRSYAGHGIGREMHEEPQVPNYGTPGRGPRLQEGMVLAIEPMVNLGTWEVEVLPDRWTVVTRDRCLSAHFEHTVAIGANDPAVLTL